MTYNELLAEAQALAESKRDNTNDGAAKRDLSIAITAIEDALTRYNSACYRIADTWKRADPDA